MKNSIYIALCICLTSCATVTEGTTQQVTINTTPDNGADCSLQSKNGNWTVKNTPAKVMVRKSGGALSISCSHKNGSNGHKILESASNTAAYGNFLVGGLAGAMTDFSYGSAYNYPPEVTIELTKE